MDMTIKIKSITEGMKDTDYGREEVFFFCPGEHGLRSSGKKRAEKESIE